MMGLLDGEKSLMISSAVSIQYMSVTDGQTDTDRRLSRLRSVCAWFSTCFKVENLRRNHTLSLWLFSGLFIGQLQVLIIHLESIIYNSIVIVAFLLLLRIWREVIVVYWPSFYLRFCLCIY